MLSSSANQQSNTFLLIMSELAKAFEPSLIEDKWSCYWKENNCFRADATSSKPPFCIVMPPPNVTGVLHMGHALVNTLQDVLVRWKRMSGYEALWVPGTDHAGIATQTVVERNLIKQTGKRRKDFSREEFLSHVWQWKEESQNQIIGQLKKLGCSCDWSRLCFTMDEERNTSVKTVFKKLFDEGLIYRGDYLVNWDPVTQTALADDEVEYEEKSSFLWYFRYPLVGNQDKYIVIATTRPETLLGDTAVAISAQDERYVSFIGKKLLLPIMNREIPIITDHKVDPTFGTGAVKVTPAHDPNDYEMGITHNLPFITIMTPEGKINENGAAFCGMTMEEARQAVVAKMKELGHLVKVEPHAHRVGISYRSKAVIEPYLSKQWFVKMSHFKPLLKKAVEEGQVKLVPENWKNTYFHWIDNLRDWCISRQLWWGHRIPIWYNKTNPDEIICYAGEGDPLQAQKNPDAWAQEEDVLDTWFSSALWPFSTLGWPAKTAELTKFYPNATLVTGHDILFFWVARMIMMGSYTMGEVPFPETFLHGLIYGKSYWKYLKDGSIAYITGSEKVDYDLGKALPEEVHFKWEKMSKSKGNIIDPIEILSSYGTDAMRMALCASATQARQIDLDRRKFEEFKNFANKVWNGARFVFMHIETLTTDRLGRGIDLNTLQLEDKWILSLLSKTIQEVHTCLSHYEFDKAALLAYDFFWKEFCAYYVEIVKPVLFEKKGTPLEKENKQILLTNILLAAVRLLHPMAPFITEELFSLLKEKFSSAAAESSIDPYTQNTIAALKAPCCMLSSYPAVIREEDINPAVEASFTLLDEVIRCIRNIRAEMQLPPGTATEIFFIGNPSSTELELVKNHQNIIEALVRVSAIHLSQKEVAMPFSAQGVVSNVKILIPLPQELKEKESVRLVKEKEKLIAQENGLRQKLANGEFVEKAPKEIVEKLSLQLQQVETQLLEISKKLEQLLK